jgi:hypothetical protein
MRRVWCDFSFIWTSRRSPSHQPYAGTKMVVTFRPINREQQIKMFRVLVFHHHRARTAEAWPVRLRVIGRWGGRCGGRGPRTLIESGAPAFGNYDEKGRLLGGGEAPGRLLMRSIKTSSRWILNGGDNSIGALRQSWNEAFSVFLLIF